MISKRTYGFTLIELILAISLISIVILISTNLIIFGTKAHKLTFKEYSMQSDIRKATEKTNDIVRYSKAIFAVPKSFVESVDIMDPGWNYFMVSPDGKRIVIMEYDKLSDKHIEKVIVEESEGISYYVQFEKDNDARSDSVLKYRIYAYNTDNTNQKTNEKLIFESTVETNNAIQVADKGSVSSPSIALAFRGDGQTSGKGKNQIAYITIIVDVSGSMNDSPNGQKPPKNQREHTNARIKNVREALVGTSRNRENGIIQKFANEENIFLSLVTFSTSGNYPVPTANDYPNSTYPIYEVYNNSTKNTLINEVDKLKASGGTNTGDGLRQAYYLHEDFRTRMNEMGTPIKEKDQVHHYMILLVDGETTYQVNTGTWNDNGSYRDTRRTERINGITHNRYDWATNWRFTPNSSSFYLDRGNINVIQNNPDDEPLNFSHTESRNNWFRTDYYVYYGEKNSPVDSYSIIGNGSTIINNSGYVKAVGNKIKAFDSGTGIKSYLIGYASGLTKEINYLGDCIGTDTNLRYKYDDPNFNLDEIFKNIATDIMADFWLATGPQIMK